MVGETVTMIRTMKILLAMMMIMIISMTFMMSIMVLILRVHLLQNLSHTWRACAASRRGR